VATALRAFLLVVWNANHFPLPKLSGGETPICCAINRITQSTCKGGGKFEEMASGRKRGPKTMAALTLDWEG